MHTVRRFWRWLAVVLLVGQGMARAAVPGPLVLDDGARVIDAWGAVRMLADPQGSLTPAQVLARLGEFTVPQGPHGNLGMHRGAVWLHLPLRVPASGPGSWVLDIDYPSLLRIDLIQLSGGQVSAPVTLGAAVPRWQWPMPGRAPAVALALAPGQDHALLLRIETAGGMVVPIRLSHPAAYKLAEERAQAMLGLLNGLVLFLLLYSLTQWLAIREPMFLDYALINLGVVVLTLAHFGQGPQHLWPQVDWLTRNAAPASVLLGTVGSFRFVARWLAGMGPYRKVQLGLQAGAWFSGLSLVALGLGWLGYRQAVMLGSVLAPVPMLLALPLVYRHAKAGNRQARLMLLGWACYCVGAFALAFLIHGVLPGNWWTQHVFQLASLAEMTFFMALLGQRTYEVRQAAEAARHENASLLTQARTDPLTGLLNRRGLQLALEAALRSARPDSVTAVFAIDLDGFKPINDRLGHEAGDALLVGVGARLKAQVRAADVVARVGGDEFVMVVAGLPGEADAARLGAQLLSAFERPIVAHGHSCRVGLTIGYCLAPHDGLDGDSLLRCADAAMYSGKHSGRNCVRRGVAASTPSGLHTVGTTVA